MTGIIPPSILTMQYAVDTGFKKYVNLSFPFRVQIENIWFTADDALSGAGPNNDGGANAWDLERTLRLGAVKQRNASTSNNAPSDVNLVWAPDFNWYGPSTDLDAVDKPTIWFGNPDTRANEADNDADTPEQEVQLDDWWDTNVVYRSSVRPLPSVDRMSYWFNYGWGEQEFNDNKYKTDLSVMNPDEFMSLFLYTDGGDWNDYTNESGIATIFVQYTGMGGNPVGSPTRIWD